MEDFSSSSLQFYDPVASKKKAQRRIIAGACLVAAVGIGIGVIIGWFSHTTPDSTTTTTECNEACPFPPKLISDEDPTISQRIIANMRADNIETNLRDFTTDPHLGGTEGEDLLASTLYDMWTKQGLDYVTKVTYEVLLSYPNDTDPSFVYLLDADNNVLHKSQEVEEILSPDQNRSDVVRPFNAYSHPGDVEGELVYVNYGRIEDFVELADNYSVNVTGKIVIARYGSIFRGDKVSLAARYGAIGVILYSDPADYSVDVNEPAFPDSWWLPGTGVQRGTVFLGDGDPLTPGYPATGG